MWSEEEVVPHRRKSIMMDSSLRDFTNMIDNTEEFMEKEIEQLPIRLQDRWFSLKRSVAETQSQSRSSLKSSLSIKLSMINIFWLDSDSCLQE